MRTGCVIALVGLLASLAAAAEQEFPYAAYIARDESLVRCGPGRNYYTTEKLPLGETVEVYRHEDDWCAIRPPTESFSWVRADDLRIGRDGIGIVAVEGAASRIGSHTSGLRDVIQVRLERGEEVEVLDAVQVSNDNGVEFYCKVAPPSGEFRWIHRNDISREEPAPDAAGSGDSDERQRSKPGSRNEPQADEEYVDRADHWGSWVRSRRTDPGRADEAIAAVEEPAEPSASARRSAAQVASTSDDSSGSRSNRRPVRRDGQGPVAAQIEAIDRELSRIVVEEPAQWDLGAVRQRAVTVSEKATTADDRQAVADLQQRIDRFDDIRRRSLALAEQPSTAKGTSERLASSLTSASPAEQSQSAEIRYAQPRKPETPGREYDGVGKLTRVVSQRPGAPRYALVNSANEVVSFVSPAAGVNLQSYEGQHVGISGQRGYMPELKKPHVTALRVNPLDIAQSRLARRQR